jgi:hypothetical protein
MRKWIGPFPTGGAVLILCGLHKIMNLNFGAA